MHACRVDAQQHVQPRLPPGVVQPAGRRAGRVSGAFATGRHVAEHFADEEAGAVLRELLAEGQVHALGLKGGHFQRHVHVVDGSLQGMAR